MGGLPLAQPFGATTIVVVGLDRDPQVRQLESHFRADQDVSVELVSSAEEALRIVRSRRNVLVITEILLPQLDGLALCRAIKNDPGLRDTTAVVVLSYLPAGSRARDAGADAFVRSSGAGPALLHTVQGLIADLWNADRLTATCRAITDATSPDTAFEVAVDTAERLLGAEAVLLLLPDREERLRVRAGRGMPPGLVESFAAPADAMLPNRLGLALGRGDDQRLLGMPILVRESVAGMIVALLDAEVSEERAEWVLSILADQVATGIGRMRLQERTLELEEQLHGLSARDGRREQALQVLRHDLRTPVGAIRGYLDLLVRGRYGQVNPRQLSALDRLRLAVSHLEALVDDAEELGRLETGGVALRAEPVEVARVVRDAIGLVEQHADRAHVDLVAEVPEGLKVRADPDRLRQILVQLLDNAVKHGGQHGAVHVSAAPGAEGTANGISIRVTDVGPGVGDELADKIFDAFAEFGGRGGQGLGLTIARAVAELMNGQLVLEPRSGSGATFALRLPSA